MSLSERAAKAAKIAAEPQLYKVCEGCDSIVTKRVATCPSCHGYRFTEDPAVVIEQAKIEPLSTEIQTSVQHVKRASSWSLFDDTRERATEEALPHNIQKC